MLARNSFRGRKLLGWILAFIVAHSALANGFADDGSALPKRMPLPDNAAREKALATVREVFKGDFEKAKSVAEQSALSQKLSKVASESKDDAVSRLVLWELVAETAAKAGETKTAFAALEAISTDFEIDELALKARTFVKIVPYITSKNLREAIDSVTPAIVAAVRRDRYDVAKSFTDQAKTLVEQFGDGTIKREVESQRLEVERLEKAFADVPAAIKSLSANTADARANGIVGKFQIEKANWDAAIQHIALCGEKEFAEIAILEMRKPTQLEDQLAVADGWWKLADKINGPLSIQMKLHAAEMYKPLFAKTTGLAQKLLEARLAEAAKIPVSPLVNALAQVSLPPVAKNPNTNVPNGKSGTEAPQKFSKDEKLKLQKGLVGTKWQWPDTMMGKGWFRLNADGTVTAGWHSTPGMWEVTSGTTIRAVIMHSPRTPQEISVDLSAGTMRNTGNTDVYRLIK